MNIKRYHIGKDLGNTIQPQGQPIESPDGWWCAADEVRDEISRLQAENERLNNVFRNQGNLREEIVELKDQLRTAEQRVARECEDMVFSTIDESRERIKAKYGL